MATEMADSPDDASHALHAAGLVRLRLGQDKPAYDLFWRNMLEYPDATGAEDSLRVVVRDGRRRRAAQLDGVLETLYARLAERELGDNLLYARADLHEHELSDAAGALTLYDEVATRYPKGSLFDDSLWAAAHLARAASDPKGALRRLRKLLATREKAFLVGSYHSPWLDDSQLEAAIILRDDLGDLAGAAAMLAQLPEHYPDSTLRDDALMELAFTRERQGDTAAACRALLRLHSKFPDSKHELETAPARRTALGCKLPAE
jgi:hypothetical protein